MAQHLSTCDGRLQDFITLRSGGHGTFLFQTESDKRDEFLNQYISAIKFVHGYKDERHLSRFLLHPLGFAALHSCQYSSMHRIRDVEHFCGIQTKGLPFVEKFNCYSRIFREQLLLSYDLRCGDQENVLLRIRAVGIEFSMDDASTADSHFSISLWQLLSKPTHRNSNRHDHGPKMKRIKKSHHGRIQPPLSQTWTSLILPPATSFPGLARRRDSMRPDEDVFC